MELLSSFPFTVDRHKLKEVSEEESLAVLKRRGIDAGQPLSMLPWAIQEQLRAGKFVSVDAVPQHDAEAGAGMIQSGSGEATPGQR